MPTSELGASQPDSADTVPVNVANRPNLSSSRSTVRPIGVYMISGLAANGQQLLAADTLRGYLIEVCPQTNNTTILNPHTVEDWIDSSGLAVWEDTVWFVKGQCVFRCDNQNFLPEVFVRLPYEANGVAVWQDKVYVTCQKAGQIHVFDRENSTIVTKISQPGIGKENITVDEE